MKQSREECIPGIETILYKDSIGRSNESGKQASLAETWSMKGSKRINLELERGLGKNDWNL